MDTVSKVGRKDADQRRTKSGERGREKMSKRLKLVNAREVRLKARADVRSVSKLNEK